MQIQVIETPTQAKAKQIANHLYPYHQIVKLLLSIFLQVQPNSIEDTDIYVAGGCIRDLWLDTKYKDIDCFLLKEAVAITISKTLSKQLVNTISDDEEASLNTDMLTLTTPVAALSIPTAIDTSSYQKELDPIYTNNIIDQYNKLKKDLQLGIINIGLSPRGNIDITLRNNISIQIILEVAGQPKDVISAFDFNVNQSYYNTSSIVIAPCLENATSASDIALEPSYDPRNPELALIRLTKFALKGYQILPQTYWILINKIKTGSGALTRLNTAIGNAIGFNS